MAWVERFVKADASGSGDGTSEGNAWTLAQAAAATGPLLRLNVKAGNYPTAAGLNLANGELRWWRGYKVTPGDLDTEPTAPRVPGTDLPYWGMGSGGLTISGGGQILSNLAVVGNADTPTVSIQASGGTTRLDRCQVENLHLGGNALALSIAGTQCTMARSWFRAAAVATTAYAAEAATFLGCVFRGGGYGLYLANNGGGSSVLHCVFDDLGSHAFYGQILATPLPPGLLVILGCTFYSAGNNGILLENAPLQGAVIADCLFSQCGAFGIQYLSGAYMRVWRTNNSFYNNSAGKETGFGDNPSMAEQVETANPLVNPAAHDLSLVSTAKAVRAGCPGLYEAETYRGYFDIGGCQEASMTATEVAAAVWTPLRSAYNVGGTMGEAQTSIIAIQGTVNALSGRVPSTLSTGRMRSVVETVDAPAVTQIQAGLATAAAVQALQTDTDDLQTRLPAALVAGRMNSLTEAFSPAALVEIMNTVWGATLPGALTGNRAGAILGTRLPELVSGRMPSVVQAMDADTLTASALAADAVTEIVRGVWDEQLAQHTVVGSAAELVWDMSAAIGARLDVAVSTRLATSAYVLPPSVAAITDSVWDEVLAEHLQTGSTGEALSDAAAGGGGGGDPALIAAAVWEELLAGHTVAGSAGATLSAAGSAGDPWITILPGTYPAGTAGGILGALDTVPSDLGELSIDLASVQADTDNLQTRLPAALVSGRIPADVSGQQAGLTPAAIDAILDEVIEGPFTLRQILRILFGSQAGKTNGALGPVFNIRDVSDTKNRIQATVDDDGNRLAITVLDGS